MIDSRQVKCKKIEKLEKMKLLKIGSNAKVKLAAFFVSSPMNYYGITSFHQWEGEHWTQTLRSFTKPKFEVNWGDIHRKSPKSRAQFTYATLHNFWNYLQRNKTARCNVLTFFLSFRKFSAVIWRRSINSLL